MRDQLAEVTAQLQQSTARVRLLAARLTADGLTRRPARGGWSVAECIVHLNITSRAYFPLIDQAIEDAQRNHLYAKGPFRMDLTGRILRWLLDPPVRLRFKTPENFQPLRIGPADRVVPQFVSCQEELLMRVQRSNGLSLDKIFIASPFQKRARYNLLACFRVIAAHQRRHLWQAERI